MKSHDFAKQLTIMAKILKSGPNTELEDLDLSQIISIRNNKAHNINQNDVPKALSMLVGLNDVKKSQWVELIEDYSFKIEIRPRDATRDIIGKLLNYLSQNQEEREKLTGKKTKKNNNSSAELADALSILLS